VLSHRCFAFTHATTLAYSTLQRVATQVIQEALPTLQRLKQAGHIRAVGFSCLPLPTVRYILDRVPPG
jgi:hypothetical protein